MTEQEIIKDVCDWFDATFPNVHPMQQVRKLVEEWEEYKTATTPEHKEEEAADVAIVIITLLREKTFIDNATVFSKYNMLQTILDEVGRKHNLLESIPKKMAINKQRAKDGRWDT